MALVLAAAVVMVAHRQLIAARSAFPDTYDVSYVPPAYALVPMSLGYREALADLLWMRALIFTGSRLEGNDRAAIGRYFDAITTLAPRFHHAYTWGGVTFVYSGTAVIDRPAVDDAIAVYRRGLQQFPESHQLLYPLGMLLLHQVRSTPGYTAQERTTMAAEGAELIRRAAAYGADPLVRQYAATLIREHAGDQLARQFLESQLATAESEDYRRVLLKKLADLGGETDVAALETVRQTFSAEHRALMPYAPDGLYAVIRDEHTPAIEP